LVLFVFVSFSLFLIFPRAISSQAPSHEKIALRGFDGNPLALESKTPYSPKKTCGACHDYNRITNGYHFQQGRTDETNKIIVSDTYDGKYPWNLSPGLYGKHSFANFDSSQLARKNNQRFSEMDKSSFFFVQYFGPFHPGGGWSEDDRKGNPYFSEENKKWGYEHSGDDPRFDGDYTSFSMGNEKYGAAWDQSGVSEADCLICHLKGYQWKERGATLRGRLFRFGPTVGAGWATLNLSQDESGTFTTERVEVDYTKKEGADFENLHLKIVRKPQDENCWSCHSVPDKKKRGWQWDAEMDVHKAKGLDCIYCHPADKNHDFAKGSVFDQTVRDDLDNTMNSCEDCHYRKKDRKAPRYKHPFSPRHMKRIACQTCHIPYQAGSADLVLDYASSGETKIYETSIFLSGDPIAPKKYISGMISNIWHPAFRDYKGKIIPVKPLIVLYWGDFDEKTNIVKPIPLWKIRDMKKPALKDDDRDGFPEINTLDEIKAFLKALREKDRFGYPIAHQPVLMKGGVLHRLDKKGEVEKIKHEQAEPLDFSLSHNVMSGPGVIGGRGCKDCHAKNSSFFLRKILIDPYDEKGLPVYIEAWERMGVDKEKLSRLLLEQ
jgi:hypothetical protein